MSEPFDLPEVPPPLEPDEPPEPRPRKSGPSGALPWVLAGISVATLGGVTIYGKKVVDEQAARTTQAQRLAEEYGARTGRLEQDRKDALRQSMDLSQKLDEVTAARTTLADQLKDKEGALASLNQRHEALINELRSALRTAKGKALPKRVSQALARDAAASAPPAGAPTAARPHPPRHSP